jgi:hypothetical protein
LTSSTKLAWSKLGIFLIGSLFCMVCR